ncbi:ABC transporter permease [Halalkalibacillus halophilus]|uniref:ABC transporter permease n=1 Tax=Halalkalibacillus halophilus TaxID=392827 RepID=UPI0003F7C577|nr:ABC transporter permease [Halalkalibacillus halophilus]
MIHAWWHRTGTILRLQAKRDRIRIPIWIVSFIAATILSLVAFQNVYPTAAERQQIVETLVNPAMIALLGKVYGIEDYTLGAILAHQMLAMTALVVGVMSILLVARHTREDEEIGRLELIRALPTGRLASLTATMLLLSISYFVLGILLGALLSALGVESVGMEGSFLYGAALATTGIFFMAITALTSQLAETSRGTVGLAFAILGIAYLTRAIGDVTNETISWFSPFGWILESQVYVNNYWWTIFLTLGVAVVIMVIAFYLHAIRDSEAGFLPTKAGKDGASSFLQTPFGFSLRLQRTQIISWGVALFIFGGTYGAVLSETETYVAEIEVMRQILDGAGAGNLIHQFVAYLAVIIAIFATIPMIQAVFRLSKEEKANRLESIYAGSISKTKIFLTYISIAFLTSFIMLSLAGIGMAVAGISTTDGGVTFSEIYLALINYMPATWMMIGVAVLFVGIGKWKGFVWLYLGYTFALVYLGNLLQLPEWVEWFSPFSYISEYPIEDFSWLAWGGLTIEALIFMVIGLILFARRDLKG